MKALPAISGLQGVYAAAITPRGSAGDIAFGAIFELIDYLCAARVSGIALFTAWGEYPALAVEERARLTYLAVKRSRVPVLAGVGSATLDHSVELAREARSAGAAAVLLPPPLNYHYDRRYARQNDRPYDQDDIFEFYSQFAAQLGPGSAIFLSGPVQPQTACRLLETGRFAGVETEAGGIPALDALRACTPGSSILSGDDALFVPARSQGFGALSGAACAAPELTMALDAAICAGDSDAVGLLEARRQQLLSWLDKFPVPVGVKTAVTARGIRTGSLPVPLSPAKQQCLEQFRDWFKGWLPGVAKLPLHV